MPKKKINSVRALAKYLGVSHTTVSDALRDNPRVAQATRQSIQEAAKKMGYKYNPMAGAVMSEIRRSTVGTFRGTIAVVDIDSAKSRPPAWQAFHSKMVHGAEVTANDLGYKIDLFSLADEKISLERLNGILMSRGIRAVFFLPVFGKPDISKLDWTNLTCIYGDYIINDPPINSVSPDHFRSMTIALGKLIELGYQRPGLVLSRSADRRLLFRWEAAFSAFWSQHTNHELLAPIVSDQLTKPDFLKWFDERKPDVVLCHRAEVLGWMRESGHRVPQSHGFCFLNVAGTDPEAAGLDLLPQVAGRRAMETLIAQLQRNEFGVPDEPLTVSYAARWHEGSTLRKQN